ncbi:hypothetical protein B484DRAFT_453441 [Ochromonadaceae sp. CCMP2298]|nr:hypothetical protein B484DRAFT_453441 [Ochromonadaceae sp. CCMP2298]
MEYQEGLKLTDYGGYSLTEAEKLYDSMIENVLRMKAEKKDVKRREKEMMVKMSRKVDNEMQRQMEVVRQQTVMAQQAKAAQAAAEAKVLADARAKVQAEAKAKAKFKAEEVARQVVKMEEEEEQEEEEDIAATASKAKRSKRPRGSDEEIAAASSAPHIIKKKRKLPEGVEEVEEQAPSHPQELFSRGGLLSEERWDARATPVPQSWLLPDFGLPDGDGDEYGGVDGDGGGKRNTLGLRLTVPNDSLSWSLNLSPPDDWYGNNILLHFNPRYGKKAVLMTDKQGTWGPPMRKSMGESSRLDGLLSSEIDLMLQVRAEGMFVFANGMLSNFFPHRRDPVEMGLKALRVTLNAEDDNGNAQNVVLHKVWWGFRDPSRDTLTLQDKSTIQGSLLRAAKEQLQALPYGPRSVVVSGLKMGVLDLKECQAVEFALMNLFLDYGTEAVTIVPGQGRAYVRFANASAVGPAIEDVDGAVIQGEEGEDGTPPEEHTLQLTAMA